ncbi:MAG: capsular polysaccharide biosynthesis protein [Pseudomonadota bacterium]
MTGPETGDAAPRRLGVVSLGFLKQPRLRRALAAAGWRVAPAIGPVDAIGVWGRRGVARRGHALSRLTGAPVLTLEDGFLRSAAPGPAPVLSLILDDLGIYYDASRPSRLEALIAAGEGDRHRAARGIARLRELRLSKYNAAPALAEPLKDHVLVIDQTRGDASITGAGANAATFARMIAVAKAEHPGAEIVIRAHPETTLGRKPGHFSPADEGAGVRLMAASANPWDLIEGARAVYTVSSQLGFEALMAGRTVRCFGAPFYAGWGATDDEAAAPRRRDARRDVEQIFAAAYLDYPLYFDPWRGGLTSFEYAVEALALLRGAYQANRQGAVCVGVRLWKRRYVEGFLRGTGGPPLFDDDPARAVRKAETTGRRLIVWASKADGAPDGAIRMEDGFLRSAGLGAALTPPLSLTLDDAGIYYDPSRPSRLECLIEAAPDDAADLSRAAALRDAIVRRGVTKYNLSGESLAIAAPAGARLILVPGQVEDDASILTGAGEVRTNLALLQATRAAAPDAFIVYKPHPDVEAGLRAGAVDPSDASGAADLLASDASADAALAAADEVWTMTSLMGFEALMRGLPVTCFGAPFYAGWGLTDDRGATPSRRTARPSLDQLVHAALIDYPA